MKRNVVTNILAGVLCLLVAARDTWRPGFLGHSGTDPWLLVALAVMCFAAARSRAHPSGAAADS